MENVYETRGNFDLENLTAKAFTCLPDIKGMNYNYVKYYNVSKGNEYGILGVLVNDGINVDLRNSSKPKKDFLVNQPIALETIINDYSDINIESIDKNSKIYFFCFHDDEFKASYVEELIKSKITLADYLTDLRNGIYLFEPKKGNGGVLTVL